MQQGDARGPPVLDVQVRLVPRQFPLLGIVQPHGPHVVHHLPPRMPAALNKSWHRHVRRYSFAT